jgi:hypothetical protein
MPGITTVASADSLIRFNATASAPCDDGRKRSWAKSSSRTKSVA